MELGDIMDTMNVVPDNLGEAIEQFASKWSHPDWFEMDGSRLKPAIRETIEQCPLIMAWNNPKKR